MYDGFVWMSSEYSVDSKYLIEVPPRLIGEGTKNNASSWVS